jgi:chemotaxis-related protein WspD
MQPSAPDHSCWKKIGTFGDRSCPELSALAHCRNCPVYAAAGRRLLAREIPAGSRDEWTRRFSLQQESGRAETVSIIVFRLKSELLALRTVFFQEAAEASHPHAIPLRTGKVFQGIVNVNGMLMLCVDLAEMLEIVESEGGFDAGGRVYPRLVVVNRDGQRYAIPADEVLGVHNVRMDSLQDAPATVSRSIRALTSGILPWKQHTVGLLEENKLFAALGRSLNP